MMSINLVKKYLPKWINFYLDNSKYIVFSKVIAATANCVNGECEFINSYHYEFAKTYCSQNLSFENVTTELSYFTILKTGQKCEVF